MIDRKTRLKSSTRETNADLEDEENQEDMIDTYSRNMQAKSQLTLRKLFKVIIYFILSSAILIGSDIYTWNNYDGYGSSC